MAFGKQQGGGRRLEKRVVAAQPALLVTMSERHRALLFNISRTGAMLRAENTPTKGTELFLQVSDLDVYAKVIWTSGEECGLEFERPIRKWDVELLEFEARRGGKATLNPAEKGGADDWVGGIAR
ncbi:MAG TPA: PilZ domain-containing protein [Sphingomicrobium sp.]|nr:PilZ domain-containing protein [Sphingomicrobium sp.]